MQVCITYWYHSCFTLEIGGKVMLFDYPKRGMDSSIDDKIKERIDDSELYVFISHAHGDHFSPEVTNFTEDAERTHFMISSDVPVRGISNEVELSKSETLTSMEPDKVYQVADLKVRTWKSNDAGIALLIHQNNKKIYYAGDLAKWNWPEWDEQKVKEHVRIFDDVVRELQEEDIEIAFSNMDERLPSWAGPIDFMEKVEPSYFIPMHTFGNESWLNDLIDSEIDAQSEIFHYEKPGDHLCCDI
ncbi:MAG: MBL fold metallo-hydrolase [Candidatus Thermoplasmatota archaeon]